MKHYKPTQHSIAHSFYCMAYGMAYVYGKAMWKVLDWVGRKLADLCDHSDFFAGVVWTIAIMTAWEVLAK